MLGSYKTNGLQSAVHLPLHPAYNKPGLPAIALREFVDKVDSAQITLGDPDKAAMKSFELSQLPDPPLRLVLGQDALAMVRAQIGKLVKDADASEDWSKDLTFEN